MKNLSYDLGGKVVVVTGGSRGIGLEIARLLLVQGGQSGNLRQERTGP